MKKALIVFFVILIGMPPAFAQNHTFQNVLKMNIRNRGTIMENNTLAGYFVLYSKEKVDKKNIAFSLELIDNDLNVVKTIEIIQPKNSVLLENVFNGNAFMLMFYDGKTLTVLSYDKKGVKLGEKKYEDLTKRERFMLNAALNQDEQNATIFPMGTSGFIKNTAVENDKLGYEIEAFDNNLKSLWKYASDEKSKEHEMAQILFTQSDYIALNVVRRKSVMNNKMNFELQLIDVNTGKKVFGKEMKDNNSDISLLSTTVSSERNEVLISGEYYAPGDDMVKSKSQGLYVMSMDLTGKQKIMKKLSWALDLAKVQSSENEKGPAHFSIFFHKLVRMPGGKMYVIGEQYKKTVSAAGMASMLMSGGRGGASVTSITVYNMVVLEFDSTFSLLNSYEVPKKKTEVLLPAGSAYASTSLLGHMVKSLGGFDYEFTSLKLESGEFYSLYKDYNRKEEGGDKADLMVGVLSVRDNKFKSDRFPFNTEGNSIWISPSKPGYIAIAEYTKKAKTIVYHLEKIVY